MKKLLTLFLLLSIFSCKAASTKSIDWTWDIEKAMKDSKTLNKPIMIDFTTDWCTWCKKLDAETYTNKDVIIKSANFIALKVNPEKGTVQSDFAKKYQVTGYPTILFIDSNSRILNRVGGFQGPQDFLKSIEKAEKTLNIDSIIEKYKKGDLNSADELIEIYAGNEQYLEALNIISDLQSKNKIPNNKEEDYFMIAGFAYIQAMDLNKAKESFEKIINKKDIIYNDNYFKAYLYFNYSMFLNGDSQEAIKSIEKLISDKNTSNNWKKEFSNFLDWMKNNVK